MNPDFKAVGVFEEHFNRYLTYVDPFPPDTEILKISFYFLRENQVGEVAGWVRRNPAFETTKAESAN
ncbi:MAG: hypothetical protein ACRD2B_01435 [Terriglobia bacterium]